MLAILAAVALGAGAGASDAAAGRGAACPVSGGSLRSPAVRA